jgi:hypothetical protein
MVGVKKKQIDIGVRKKPTASESAQSDQGKLWRTLLLRTDYFFPEMKSNLFDQRSPL